MGCPRAMTANLETVRIVLESVEQPAHGGEQSLAALASPGRTLPSGVRICP